MSLYRSSKTIENCRYVDSVRAGQVLHCVMVYDALVTVGNRIVEGKRSKNGSKRKSSSLGGSRDLSRQHNRFLFTLYAVCKLLIWKLLPSHCLRFLLLFSSDRLLSLLVFVVKCKFVFGNVVTANIGPSGCGDEGFYALEDSAINALRRDVAVATRREEVEDIGSASCWTL